MKTVTIYTDGACSGNPGPGGWCAILEYAGKEKMLSGGEASTTNNRMELTAVIQALLALKEPCVVELYSDSKYVLDALERGWAWGWKRKGRSSPIRSPRLIRTCGRSFWASRASMSCTTTGSRATRKTKRITAATSRRCWKAAASGKTKNNTAKDQKMGIFLEKENPHPYSSYLS